VKDSAAWDSDAGLTDLTVKKSALRGCYSFTYVMSNGKLEHYLVFCAQTVEYTIQNVAWRYLGWCGADTAASIGTVGHVENIIGEHFSVLDEPADMTFVDLWALVILKSMFCYHSDK
jgi:hypothetical protein